MASPTYVVVPRVFCQQQVPVAQLRITRLHVVDHPLEYARPGVGDVLVVGPSVDLVLWSYHESQTH